MRSRSPSARRAGQWQHLTRMQPQARPLSIESANERLVFERWETPSRWSSDFSYCSRPSRRRRMDPDPNRGHDSEEDEIGRRRSIKPFWHCLCLVGFATGSMSDQLPSSRAWSVAGAPQTPIICDVHSCRHSAARSAMSSPCRFAVATIARSIGVVTNALGGTRLVSIRPPPRVYSGSRAIHCRSQSPRRKPNCETKII